MKGKDKNFCGPQSSEPCLRLAQKKRKAVKQEKRLINQDKFCKAYYTRRPQMGVMSKDPPRQ
jgi:hypothetical protein